MVGGTWFASLPACGGSAPEAKTAGQSHDTDTADYEADAAASDSYCLDGTCFDCGESFCMLGWYCDEEVAGGPACSFVPECGSESNCDCVESALASSCSCTERNGGVYVRCE